MGRQKNSGFTFLIVGVIGAMMVCFFNLYLHTNRLDLLTKTPGAEMYDTYRFLCMLSIGIILCFSFAVLCISIRFQQKLLASILFIALGFIAASSIQYSFMNYYHVDAIYLKQPLTYILRIGILLVLSLIIYIIFEVPQWLNIVSAVVNGTFIFVNIVFALFAKTFSTSITSTWYGVCEVYQIICIIGLLVAVGLFVKKDLSFSKHIMVALVAFACYLPLQLVPDTSFKPCYLSFYEVSFLIMYMIVGFSLLNFIVSSYEAHKRAIALEQETDKGFIQRREHYEIFAEQLDGIKEVPEYTYSPILAIEALLLYYEKYAKLKKIDFSANMVVPKNIKIKHGELCLALANLLDNAVEACDKMESGKKYIQVEATMVDHMMMLEVRNSYDGQPLVPCGDLFYTTKEFTPKGMGLTTTKDIATRYNGSLSIQAKADVPAPYFVAQLFFSRVAN